MIHCLLWKQWTPHVQWEKDKTAQIKHRKVRWKFYLQMSKLQCTCFFGFRILFNNGDDCINNCLLVIKSSLKSPTITISLIPRKIILRGGGRGVWDGHLVGSCSNRTFLYMPSTSLCKLQITAPTKNVYLALTSDWWFYIIQSSQVPMLLIWRLTNCHHVMTFCESFAETKSAWKNVQVISTYVWDQQ